MLDVKICKFRTLTTNFKLEFKFQNNALLLCSCRFIINQLGSNSTFIKNNLYFTGRNGSLMLQNQTYNFYNKII